MGMEDENYAGHEGIPGTVVRKNWWFKISGRGGVSF